MSLLKPYFVTIFFCFIAVTSFAQRNYDGYNKLGVTGGLLLFDITTDHLVTKQGQGFTVGFTTRGAFRNRFDLIYGINYTSGVIEVSATDFLTGGIDQQNVKYTVQGAQINFLGSYNIVKDHLSVEFGPVLAINGKMKLDSARFQDYIVDGYNQLKTSDIEDISKVNFLVAAGLTAGIENFRISAQYQYGVTNALNALNDKNLERKDFKGNTSIITVSGVVYF